MEEYQRNHATIEDWAQIVHFNPDLYYRPRSVDELRDAVATLAFGSLKRSGVRVLGGLHSCSHIYASDTIIDVEDVPRTLEFSPDNSKVVASANWHLHDFLIELSKKGKSLTATGGTDAQTLAGLIATNTAPATPKHSLYSTLDWIEYLAVDEQAREVQVRRVARDDPAFRAVLCGLGVTGVATRVQFGLIDEPYFETIQDIIPIKDALDNVESTSNTYDFWRIDWLPDSKKGLLWAAKRIPKEKADPNGDYKHDASESALEFLFKAWDKISGHAAGPLLDVVTRVMYGILAATYGKVTANGPLRNMLPVDRRAPLHVAMSEWSFDPKDISRVLDLCHDYFERKGWPNLPIEIELGPVNDAFMSPWNWKGLPYIVKFNFMFLTDICTLPAEKELIYTHLKGLWDHVSAAGVPFKAHWGKINFLDPAFVKKNYGLDEFRPYIQPMFMNDYLKVRLGA